MLEPQERGKVESILEPSQVDAARKTDRTYASLYEGYMEVPFTEVRSFDAPEPLYTPRMNAGYDLRVEVDVEEWFPSPT
ncbi:MAG: hypothetical protein RLZZ142_210 [Verrucomicrobiota bacterium]